MFTLGYSGNTYYFYTEEEAIQRDIAYNKNWRLGQPGDWVLSDNGFVCLVIKRYNWSRKSSSGRIEQHHSSLVFACGQFNPYVKSIRFIAEPTKRYRFTSILKRNRITSRVNLMIDLYMQVKDVKVAYKLAFHGYKGRETIDSILTKLFQSPKYRKKFMKEVARVLEEKGLTDDFLTKALMSEIDKGNYDALLLGLKLKELTEKPANEHAFSFQSFETLPETAKKFISDGNGES